MSLQSDSESILELISILARNSFRITAPVIIGWKLDDEINKQGWTPPHQTRTMGTWKWMGHCQIHNPPAEPLDKHRLAVRVKWAIYPWLKTGSQMRCWYHNYIPQVCNTGSGVQSELWHHGDRFASSEVLVCRLWTRRVLRPLTRLFSLVAQGCFLELHFLQVLAGKTTRKRITNLFEWVSIAER